MECSASKYLLFISADRNINKFIYTFLLVRFKFDSTSISFFFIAREITWTNFRTLYSIYKFIIFSVENYSNINCYLCDNNFMIFETKKGKIIFIDYIHHKDKSYYFKYLSKNFFFYFNNRYKIISILFNANND